MEARSQLSQLMTLTVGGQLDPPSSRAQHTMLSVFAILASLALASLWGLAAGSASIELSIANAYKVPLVVLLSALAALPAGVVTLRLTSAGLAARELASTFATSIFGGTLVLATLAPLVAIYYHTSSKVGVPLAVGSVFTALAIASLLFGRAVARRVSGRPGRTASLVAVGVLVGLFLAALLQFVALAAPIISEVTPFSGGFDTVFSR